VGKPKANPNVPVAFGAATPHISERPVHTARIGGAGVHTARIGGAGVRVGGGRHRGGSGDGGIERNKRPEPKAALVFEGTKQFAPSARRAPVGRSGALW